MCSNYVIYVVVDELIPGTLCRCSYKNINLYSDSKMHVGNITERDLFLLLKVVWLETGNELAWLKISCQHAVADVCVFLRDVEVINTKTYRVD